MVWSVRRDEIPNDHTVNYCSVSETDFKALDPTLNLKALKNLGDNLLSVIEFWDVLWGWIWSAEVEVPQTWNGFYSTSYS